MIEIEDVSEPFCGTKKKKLTPLSIAFPEIAAEWCYRKNQDWAPSEFSRASSVKAWWTCSRCKRNYKAQIYSRTVNQTGCPFCTAQKPSSDNNLADFFPAVSREWHPVKNGKLSPSEVCKGSSNKFWWLCLQCNRSWKTTVYSRTGKKSCCPHCRKEKQELLRITPRIRINPVIILNAGKKISRKWYKKRTFTSLSETHPQVASQWHPSRNGEWSPEDFPAGSKATAWWKCPQGPDHEWQASISNRSCRGSGCPFCDGKKVSIENSFANNYPQIAAQWHRTKNGSLKPTEVTIGSKRKVWWKCPQGPDHEWQATVECRTLKNYGCPCCSGKKASITNSLESLYPEIASLWHLSKNKNLKPSDFNCGSHAEAWWKCSAGHVYQMEIRRQIKLKQPCAKCRQTNVKA